MEISNKNTAKSRLIDYLRVRNVKNSEFYKKTGLGNGFLDKNDNINSDKIEIIVSNYPDLNPTWLLIGQGEMLQIPVKSRFEFLINHFANGDKKKFASKAGINITVVEKAVTGRGVNPSFSDLQNILCAFEYINPGWLIAGQGEPFMKNKYTEMKQGDKVETLDNNTSAQENSNIEKNNDKFSVSDLVKAITNLSEAALINANAAMKNAEANDRYSKNMEKMLDVLFEDNATYQKKAVIGGYTGICNTA